MIRWTVGLVSLVMVLSLFTYSAYSEPEGLTVGAKKIINTSEWSDDSYTPYATIKTPVIPFKGNHLGILGTGYADMNGTNLQSGEAFFGPYVKRGNFEIGAGKPFDIDSGGIHETDVEGWVWIEYNVPIK